MATTYTISESQLDNIVDDINCEEGSTCKKIKDTHLTNQERLVKMNSYFGKKYSAQTRILKTIYIMVICIIVIYAIRVYTDFIPDWILTTAMAIVIAGFIVDILFQAVDISNRNNLDYDLYDVNLTNLPKLAGGDTSPTGAGAGGTMPNEVSSATAGMKGCHNQECCPAFFTFNSTLGYCSLNPFT